MKRQVSINWLFGRTFSIRLFLGGLLLMLLITTRWSWIDCDGGIPSLNEYGYFATDEGYYCNGGKMKYLRGKFISAVRASPCTYAICPSTHLMTYTAFNIFGQTSWAHRFFPLLLCTTAWLVLFTFLSRKTLPWIAFLWCSTFALNPFLIAYGRTACNDTLMGALILMAYVLTRRKNIIPAAIGGFFFGLGLWIKMSIWILFPLGLSAAAMSTDRHLRLRRMVFFILGFALSATLQYGLIRYMILDDAISQNVTVNELLQISNSSYALPNVFDWQLWMKALSSFPRAPTDGTLGLWTALFLILPALMLFRRLTDRPFHWDARLILYATPLLYTAGILLLPVYYSHYFIPVIMSVPIVWLEARHDLKRWTGGQGVHVAPFAMLALTSLLLAYYAFRVHPHEADMLKHYISTAYNFPETSLWTWNGLYIVGGAIILTALILIARQQKPSLWIISGVLLSALVVADLFFSTIPLCEAYSYIKIYSGSMRSIVLSLQITMILLVFAIWGMPSYFRVGIRWYLLLPVLLIFGILINSVWRHAVWELTERGHLHKQAAAELAKLLPSNAVVFGERAPQVLLSLPPRTAALPNSDPVPTLYAVNKRQPTFPLYALIDSEHNYHYAHYEKQKDRIRMEVIHTVKLPSFNTCQPVPAYLVRLHLLDRLPKAKRQAK